MKLNIYSLFSVVVGIIFFALCVGFTSLNVSSMSFLMNGDAAQHWVGWEFFRNTPLLQWPLGKNYDYGIQLHNSIVYTDSIPVVAMFFKLFSSYLPVTFQYTGIWLALCFCLQGFFSFLLIKKLTNNNIYSLLASVVFLTSVPFIDRIGGHFALSAHWLILWSLYLYFNANLKHKTWVFVLSLSSWVHAYLVAMTLVVFIFDLANKTLKNRITTKQSILYFVVSLSMLFFSMYSIGYFTISGSFSSGGFGYYKLNLNSILNPYYEPFSSIIKPLPAGKGDYEGVNYIGFGVISLLIVSIFGVKRAKKNITDELSKNYPLLILSILLTIYSLSNIITLGNSVILEFYIPNLMKGITNTFRASGRFFWIVYYLIFTIAIIGVYRFFKLRTATIILLACATLQVYDVHHVFKVRKDGFKTNHSGYTLDGKNWGYISKNYKKLLTPTPWLFGDDYLKYAYFTSTNNMALSFGYFARVNLEIWNKQTAKIENEVNTGNLDKSAAYLFKDYTEFEKVLHRVPGETYYFEDNGVYVLALKNNN